MHATVSGNAHFIAEDDQHAIALVKHLLSYLPSNNTRTRRTACRADRKRPGQGIND
jgi:acetyl-CoA carboxylase carboxyltransferase component